MMTEKEIKDALKEYKSLVNAHNEIVDIINSLDARATATGSVTPRADKVLTSLPQTARYEDVIINKADLERVLQESFADIEEAKRRVELLIIRAPNDKHRTVLRCRYLYFMDFFTISKVTHYTEDNVYKIHRKAIKAIANSFR